MHDLQKAGLMKRMSAFLIDLILMMILVTGAVWLLSAATGYDNYNNTMESEIQSIRDSYGISKIVENHKVDLQDYLYLTEEQKNELPEDVRNTIENCIKDINSNEAILDAYSMVTSLTILIVSLGLLFPFVILEFIVPIILKNGQTVGKKIFGIGVMRLDGVKVTPIVVFVRSILGKYTLETMFPVAMALMLYFGIGSIFNLGAIALLLIFQIILVIATKTNSTIHDILSSTVTVDIQSQRIFESREAKQEFIRRIHEEEANKAKYF